MLAWFNISKFVVLMISCICYDVVCIVLVLEKGKECMCIVVETLYKNMKLKYTTPSEDSKDL